jgi:hypothetical protein
VIASLLESQWVSAAQEAKDIAGNLQRLNEEGPCSADEMLADAYARLHQIENALVADNSRSNASVRAKLSVAVAMLDNPDAVETARAIVASAMLGLSQDPPTTSMEHLFAIDPVDVEAAIGVH